MKYQKIIICSCFQEVGILTIADLGDINAGETVEDTYFALKRTSNSILNRKKDYPYYIRW